jgi:hypothetical protein
LEREHAARRGDRGGAVVQAPRPNIARLAPSAAALAAAAGLVAWASLTAGEGEELVAAVGVAGAAALAVALVGRWQELLPWAIALLGAQYAAALLLRDGGVDALAPLYAAGLLVTAELAYWALERGAAPRSVVVTRVGALFALALGTAAAGAVLLAASTGSGEGGLGLDLVGLAAATAALGLVTWLAWRSRAG